MILPFGLSQGTVLDATSRTLLRAASDLGCVGVELRNDLGQPLFDGRPASDIAEVAREKGLRILNLVGLQDFNNKPEEKQDMIEAFVATAAAAGVENITLLPWIAFVPMGRGLQQNALRKALQVLQPIFDDHGMRGLIGPLGYLKSSLQYKEDVVNVLDALGQPKCFAVVHDTFHHALAPGDQIYPEQTALIRASGVSRTPDAGQEVSDIDRMLIGPDDQLDTLEQLRVLIAGRFNGPIVIDANKRETEEIATSIDFMTTALVERLRGSI